MFIKPYKIDSDVVSIQDFLSCHLHPSVRVVAWRTICHTRHSTCCMINDDWPPWRLRRRRRLHPEATNRDNDVMPHVWLDPSSAGMYSYIIYMYLDGVWWVYRLLTKISCRSRAESGECLYDITLVLLFDSKCQAEYRACHRNRIRTINDQLSIVSRRGKPKAPISSLTIIFENRLERSKQHEISLPHFHHDHDDRQIVGDDLVILLGNYHHHGLSLRSRTDLEYGFRR